MRWFPVMAALDRRVGARPSTRLGLEVAGGAWIVATFLVFVSQFVRRRTALPSGVASTTQAIGVAALTLAALGTIWGFSKLARSLSRQGDFFGAVILWSVVAGILLLPVLLGGFLLLPGLVALIVRGHLGRVGVRLPTAAVLAGLVTAGWVAGWPGGIEGPSHLNALVILGGAAEGAALIWFGRAIQSLELV